MSDFLRRVHRFARSFVVLTFVVCATNDLVVAQIQTWADPAMTVRDGLITWLDASRLDVIPGENGEKSAANGDAISAWPSGADPQQKVEQSSEKSRPRLVKVGESWVIRFDGEDDHLRRTGTHSALHAATVFLVCAPHSNPGDFRGLVATNAVDRRDYESGFTIDLGPGPTSKFDHLNVEGRGFGGAKDLVNSSSDLGTLHIIEASFDPSSKLVTLLFDGKNEGTRPFAPTELSFDQLTIGARFYTNGPGAMEVRGPFHGDLAEVLIYDRVLSADETKAVREYLKAKYSKLAEDLPGELKLSTNGGLPLVKAENPPAIQMLQPGFSVHELPVELTNINNVRYRADGKLVTLGYNGDIHLLSDTDGDGLDDKVELFWKNEGSVRGPLGMLLTPPNYPKGNGVFFPSKGKVSLVVDKDGDDKADEEIIVATGWKEISQNVDAVGITMDNEGCLYFGLGTVNYANAYMVNNKGEGEYELTSDRGTVQKVSADFSKRETICTGIRFPIAFAFNREGDLFCTEQEGATWLPNGNPLDELLHIRLDGVGPNGKPATMRHYGFPPRHPKHNPNVIDEPSTFDYAPQHQSTCGMVFNESVNSGPVLGPRRGLETRSSQENLAASCGERN